MKDEIRAAITLAIPSRRADGLAMGAIYSALNQTLAPIRAIMLDTSEVGIANLESFSNLMRYLPVEVFRAPGVQPYEARNALAEEVNTNWIWFIDDDFLADHKCLEIMYRAAIKYKVGMVGGVKSDVVPEPWESKEFNIHNIIRDRDVAMTWCDTACCLVKTEAWLENCKDMKFPPKIVGEDYAVTARVAERAGCIGAAGAHGIHISWDGKQSDWTNNQEYTLENIETCQGLLQARPHMTQTGYIRWTNTLLNRIQPGVISLPGLEKDVNPTDD